MVKKTNINRIRDLLQESPDQISAFESFVPDGLQSMAKQNLMNYCKKSKSEMAELTPEIMSRHSGIPKDQFGKWLESKSFTIWLYDTRTLEEIFASQAERALRRLSEIAHSENQQGKIVALKAILDYSLPKPQKQATASNASSSSQDEVSSLSDDELELELSRYGQ